MKKKIGRTSKNKYKKSDEWHQTKKLHIENNEKGRRASRAGVC